VVRYQKYWVGLLTCGVLGFEGLRRREIDTHHTFGFQRVGAVREVHLGALRPWQLGLETLHEIEQAPGYYGVVVEGHVEGDDGAAYPDTWTSKPPSHDGFHTC
jgi:hypothetical protein